VTCRLRGMMGHAGDGDLSSAWQGEPISVKDSQETRGESDKHTTLVTDIQPFSLSSKIRTV
jgi:hypothetical protein